ncbi:hypothetical protein DPMN_086772 [Dreissena polymorpha]|uniref:Uncharacterized protein n=1 Tax=Dreissena polymorpha TaxID=45954 RepID=A0A9D4QV03_DREPO|nr:hypothetical protein DPMN_086772 [Dreissena polymorpha]
MQDMMDAVPVEESRRTSLVGGVSIYCDPETCVICRNTSPLGWISIHVMRVIALFGLIRQ